jgi:hypothetical protein
MVACSAGAFIVHSNTSKGRAILVSTHRPWSELPAPHTLAGMTKKSEEAKKSSVFETLRKKPATLVLFPFVFIFGADLLLNLAVLTKRTLEYFLLGQAPNPEPWW